MSLYIAQAQDKTSFVDSSAMNFDLKKPDIAFLERVFQVNINTEREKNGVVLLNSNSMLKKIAVEQSTFMADFATTEQDNPGERAIAYGGTRNISEIVAKISINVNKKYTYAQISQLFVDKFKTNSAQYNQLLNEQFSIVGISVALDPMGDKLYASVDLGNEGSIAPVLQKNAVKYISTKSYGIDSYNAKICSKCNKIVGIDELAQNIVIEDHDVYFVSDNLKKIKSIIKTPQDGMAIDIVSENQFACNRQNILNYKVPNKGILLKPVFFEEFYKLNTEDTKANKLKVKLGVIPKEISLDSVEVNLMIINQNIACKNLFKPKMYIPSESVTFEINPELIWDTKLFTQSEIDHFRLEKSFLDSNCTFGQSSQNQYKMYNCLCGYYLSNSIKTDADWQKTKMWIDKLKTNTLFSNDTITLIEIANNVAACISSQTSSAVKDEALSALKSINPWQISLINNQALYFFFVSNNEYKIALKWLDDFVLNENIDEDYLFSYLTLSAMYSDRMNSGLFAKVITKAKKLNFERFCDLFDNNGLSFQLLENNAVKAEVCESCKKK